MSRSPITPKSAGRSRRILVLMALALTASCAIVDSIEGGLQAMSRFAGEIMRGEGEVDADGKQFGEWEYLSEGGRVRARGRYENDVQVGVWTYFFEDGQKEYEGLLKNERREGRYQYWHPNGLPRATGHFAGGREFGDWTFWDSKGRMSQLGAFSNGLRQGRWTSYHPTGGLAAEGRYWNNQQVGRWSIVPAGGEGSSSTTSWTPMPDGLEWISETWDGGEVRREGFLLNGRQEGLWRLNHRSGELRLIGEFKDGSPNGHWAAFGDDGQLLAEGQVELGRPSGTWSVASTGGLKEVDATGFPPSMPFTGTWTDPSLAVERGVEGALGIWMAEVRAPIAEGLAADDSEPPVEVPQASREEVVSAMAGAEAPVKAQPWTEKELSVVDRLMKVYRDGGKGGVNSIYVRSSASNAPAEETMGGDESAAQSFIGKPLPLTIFKDSTGAAFDLESLRGIRVVLVVLRGYPGKVCVYCTAQTAALHEEKAVRAFGALGARLEVIFPGEKNGLEAFKAAVKSLSDVELPDYGMLYENDYIVGPMLNIEGSKVTPSTFIIDEHGIVRFAYVAKTPQDRPSVKLLVDELRKLDR